MLDRRIEERAAHNDRIAADFAGAEGVRELLRVAEREAAVEAGWPHLLIEFRALAMRDPALNRRYAAAHARTVANFASVLVRLQETRRAAARRSGGLDGRVHPGRQLLRFALERAANPAAIPDEDVARMLPRALGL